VTGDPWSPIESERRRIARQAAWTLAAALGALALLLFVTGCAAPPPQVVREAVEVRVPVPVACIDAVDLPAAPRLAADAELARLPDAELVLTLEQQRRLLREYRNRAEPLLAACARPATPAAEERKQ